MKIKIIFALLFILMISSFIACENKVEANKEVGEQSDSQVKEGVKVSSNSTESSEEGINDAKKVVADYMSALKDKDLTVADQFLTKRFKSSVKVEVKDCNIIGYAEDVGKVRRINYLSSGGSGSTIERPYDVVCLKVTYNIIYEDESQATEQNGKKGKWFTLIKESKESSWKIDEIGY